jgi:predicted unusual protein kinase regulating ubiquinone biosynthesis (AarF/ABC1/UbiB family)
MVTVNQRAEGIVQNIDIIPDTLVPSRKPRLVMYDFGQAATLNRNQADGILEIIEAIVDTDVDRSIGAFQKMGVLVDDANLDEVREKVAENYRTGKVKANRKKLRRKGYKFRDEEVSAINATSAVNNMPLDKNAAIGKNVTKSNDSKVMSYFSLPAEYAFVARAISQMDGVGKSLDPEFDFISSAAPYLVEVKGADLYIKEEVIKFFKGLTGRISKFQMETIPIWWKEVTKKNQQ